MEFDVNNLVQIAIDCYKGEGKKYSTEELDKTFSDILRKQLGGDKIDPRRLKANPETFTILETLIDKIAEDTLEGNDIFKQFTEVDTVGYGNSKRLYLENDTDLIVSNTSDGNLGVRRQRLGDRDYIDLRPETHVIRVYDELERFRAGKITTTKLVERISKAIEIARLNDIYAVFNGIDGSAMNVVTHTGDYDEDSFFEFIEKIQAYNKSQDVMIATTKKIARRIGATDGSEIHKEDIYNQGYAQYWNGIKVFALPQRFKPGTEEFALEDFIKVIPVNQEKPIKQILGGSTYMDIGDGSSNVDQTVDIITQMSWVTAFILSGKIGNYKPVFKS